MSGLRVSCDCLFCGVYSGGVGVWVLLVWVFVFLAGDVLVGARCSFRFVPWLFVRRGGLDVFLVNIDVFLVLGWVVAGSSGNVPVFCVSVLLLLEFIS